MEVTASFKDLRLFMTEILDQRRLKLIDEISISKDKETTDSGNLKVNLTINGFYL